MLKTPLPKWSAGFRPIGAAAICLQAFTALTAAAQVAAATCGTGYAPPFAASAPRRDCPEAIPRHYQPRYKGIGYEILDIESNACFVPDSAYALLDDIVERTLARLTHAERVGKGMLARDRALAVSKAMDATLIEMGFGLYIPTETLSDALVSRAPAGHPPAHIEDCDTASLILLTIAEVLNIQANLVEITLRSGSQHNYVCWPLDGQQVDWDTNARDVCETPAGQPAFQGKAMLRKETLAYAYRLRGGLWKRRKDYDRAVADYMTAMRDWPASPAAYNNFAWIVASVEWPARKSLYAHALAAAERAVQLQDASELSVLTRTDLGNYYDTLACLQAYAGDFQKAADTERRAIATSPQTEFEERLANLIGPDPKDCTSAP